LGIPTIKDRVVQIAVKLVIELIFEADFEETSYGFRPKRSANDAVKKIWENLKSGKTEDCNIKDKWIEAGGKMCEQQDELIEKILNLIKE